MGRSSLVTACLLLVLGGCGGGETILEVSRPAGERPDVDSAAAAGALKLPADQAFNYRSFRSGQDGAGRGESHPRGGNGAACRADADGEGSAWGEFQLGYCFDNTSDRPLDAVVKMRVNVSEANAIKGEAPEEETDARAESSLTFFIKDSYGTLVKEVNLLANTLVRGPNSSGQTQQLTFETRFEPKRGYYLIAAGRAAAQATPERKSTVAVEISEFALEIAWSPSSSKAQAMIDPAETPR